MAITMINPPADLVYTRNEVPVVLSTNLSDTFFSISVLDMDDNVLSNLVITPDINTLQAAVDISQILEDHTFYGLDMQNPFTHNQKALLKYQVRVLEGDSDTQIDLQTYGPFYALKGGIAQEFDVDAFAWLRNNKKFLTHAKYLRVLPDQPYLIDCLWDDQPQIMVAKAKLFFTDGTDATVVLHDYETVAQYTLIRLDAGFISNGLDQQDPEKTVYKYEVSVRNQGDTNEFEIIVFVDHLFNYKPKYFIYGNSLGGLDGCYLTGQNIVEQSVDSQNVEKHSASGIETLSFDQLLKTSGEIATGYKPKDDVRRLVEIALNGFAFEMLNNGLQVPIIIDNSSNFRIGEKDNLHGVVLKYARAYINRAFTPDDFAGEIGNEYNYDYNSEYTS